MQLDIIIDAFAPNELESSHLIERWRIAPNRCGLRQLITQHPRRQMHDRLIDQIMLKQ